MTELWHAIWPWLLGAIVVAVAVAALRMSLRRPDGEAADDLHGRALEAWLRGDLTRARDLLRDAVDRDPHLVDPYLHLGILLRLTGDPGRAAAVHRSLAVRPDLPAWRRLAVGLELAADLVDLQRWNEADDVLGQIASLGINDERWYRLRFAAALGRDDADAAAAALREGEKRLARTGGADLGRLRAAWLTDQALLCVRAGDLSCARDYLGRAKGIAAARGRVLVVKALVAAADKDPDEAVKAVAEGLSQYPDEMAPALSILENVLHETNRFARVVPILETACRSQSAPPALWMALARLYEKLDRRADALRLLTGKRGDPRLTPDAAAPYLRLLTAENPDAAFSKVWNVLADPDRNHGYRCRSCGRAEPQLRWFCPNCLAADSFDAAPAPAPRTAEGGESSTLTAPPRY